MNDAIKNRIRKNLAKNVFDQACALFYEMKRLRLLVLESEEDSPMAEALQIDLAKVADVADGIEALL